MKYFNNNKIQFQQNRLRNRRDADNLINTSWKVFLILGLFALHDDFGFGKKRLEMFVAKVVDLLDSYDKGYISIDDLYDTLKKETGIDARKL